MIEQANTLQVLELGDGVATAYAAKLLGDHGADVLKVEPAGGSVIRGWDNSATPQENPLGSGYFQALNVNKRGLCLGLASAPGRRTLGLLLSWADVVVHDFSVAQARELGLDPEQTAAAHPQLVVLSITPFGRTGPYADYAATELILSNAGGWANLCPATHSDPELAPLKVAGDQCALMAGIAGATAVLAHTFAVQSGQAGEYIDLSIQEYVASVLEVGIPAYSYKGDVVTRSHPRSLIPWRIFQAQDAPVFIVCVEQDQWERLVEFMGSPEWASLEVFVDQPTRAENQDMVHEFVQQFVSEWDAMDLYHAAQKHRICVAPVLDLEQLAGNEHLQARKFFVDVVDALGGVAQHLAPAVLTTQGRAPIRRPSPLLGQHTDEVLLELDRASAVAMTTPTPALSQPQSQSLPLSGIRVLDMTWAWAGPFCSMNLAHLGAQVIRLESSVRPDLYRRLPVHPPEMEEGLNRSGMFNQWNQGKVSVGLDLSKPEAIALVKDLVKQADIVVQNFATGVLERLGLGYEQLAALNPRIILASISGYGQSGPYREYMGYGPAIPPLTGLAAATGYIGGAAEEIGLSMPDPTAGITAACAVVSALCKRRESGVGEHLDVTLWEATGVLNAQAWMDYARTGRQPQRMGNRSERMVPHGTFRCAGEGRWVAIACVDDEQWLRLSQCLGADVAQDVRFRSLAGRKANEEELEQYIAAWCREQDAWAVTEQLQALHIAAFPTLSCADIVEDGHLLNRGFIERLDHPEVGARAHTGIPWRLRQRPNGVAHPAPCLGADTDAILDSVLGLDAQECARLRQLGVIH